MTENDQPTHTWRDLAHNRLFRTAVALLVVVVMVTMIRGILDGPTAPADHLVRWADGTPVSCEAVRALAKGGVTGDQAVTLYVNMARQELAGDALTETRRADLVQTLHQLEGPAGTYCGVIAMP